MSFFLLDAGGPLLLFGPLLVFMILCIALEALPMTLMNFAPFGRSVWIAVVVNIITLIIGFLIVPLVGDKIFGGESGLDNLPQFFGEIAIYYSITVLVEALLLKAFSKSKSWRNAFMVSSVMNLVTYIVLVTMLVYFNQ